MGVGEKVDALEAFHPDRLASRILGMGDILSLVEEAQQKVDQKKAVRLAKKIKKGKNFDLEDFRDQILQMKKMGGMAGLMDKLPGMSEIPNQVKDQVNDKELVKIEAIINSMTPMERQRPELIKGSRKKRITAGSGTQIQDLNRLLKQFKQMQKMMKKFSKGGMKNMMRNLKGRMPPGMGGGMGRMPF
jgi:signal recognition particle subunit SRP54